MAVRGGDLLADLVAESAVIGHHAVVIVLAVAVHVEEVVEAGRAQRRRAGDGNQCPAAAVRGGAEDRLGERGEDAQLRALVQRQHAARIAQRIDREAAQIDRIAGGKAGDRGRRQGGAVDLQHAAAGEGYGAARLSRGRQFERAAGDGRADRAATGFDNRDIAGADDGADRRAEDQLRGAGIEHRGAGGAAGLDGLHPAGQQQRPVCGAEEVLNAAAQHGIEIAAAGRHHFAAAAVDRGADRGAAGGDELAAAARHHRADGKAAGLDDLRIAGADHGAGGEAIDELSVVVVEQGAAGDAARFDHLATAGFEQRAADRAGDILKAAADHRIEIAAAGRHHFAAAAAEHGAAGEAARIEQQLPAPMDDRADRRRAGDRLQEAAALDGDCGAHGTRPKPDHHARADDGPAQIAVELDDSAGIEHEAGVAGAVLQFDDAAAFHHRAAGNAA